MTIESELTRCILALVWHSLLSADLIGATLTRDPAVVEEILRGLCKRLEKANWVVRLPLVQASKGHINDETHEKKKKKKTNMQISN